MERLGMWTLRWKDEKRCEHIDRRELLYGVEYEEESRASVAIGREADAVDVLPIASAKGKGAAVLDARRHYIQDPEYQVSGESKPEDPSGPMEKEKEQMDPKEKEKINDSSGEMDHIKEVESRNVHVAMGETGIYEQRNSK